MTVICSAAAGGPGVGISVLALRDQNSAAYHHLETPRSRIRSDYVPNHARKHLSSNASLEFVWVGGHHAPSCSSVSGKEIPPYVPQQGLVSVAGKIA